jgi:hypothetical protein
VILVETQDRKNTWKGGEIKGCEGKEVVSKVFEDRQVFLSKTKRRFYR